MKIAVAGLIMLLAGVALLVALKVMRPMPKTLSVADRTCAPECKSGQMCVHGHCYDRQPIIPRSKLSWAELIAAVGQVHHGLDAEMVTMYSKNAGVYYVPAMSAADNKIGGFVHNNVDSASVTKAAYESDAYPWSDVFGAYFAK